MILGETTIMTKYFPIRQHVAGAAATTQRHDVVVVGARCAGAATAMLLARHGFQSMETIHDTDQRLYEAFGLKRGTIAQVASPRVIWRGICAGLLEGHGMGKPEGDVLQLPGVFLLDNCEVSNSFRHRSAADRPDYLAVSLPV